MRHVRLLSAFLLLSSVATAADAGQGFALLEMFTSEGCPACPAAEAVLQKIQDRAVEQGEPIYALAFHVDYFDTEEWKDRYASASFGKRQMEYVRFWRANRLYTPQIVVNGQNGFVGTDAEEASKRIQKALETESKTTVAMLVAPVRDGSGKLIELVLEPSLEGAKSSVLNIALVEDGLAADSKGPAKEGEAAVIRNGVVRDFWTVPVKGLGGKFRVEWPQHVDSKRASLIAYAVSGSLRVQGVIRVSVP